MIPDFQKIMLPFLTILGDGEEHTTVETNQKLATLFGLTDEEQHVFLPSGVTKTFPNRVAWVKSHFKMAGLLENTKRSSFKITDQGKKLLSENHGEINLRTLKNIPAYLERTGRIKDDETSNEIDHILCTETPEEILETNYLKIRKNLSEELLIKIKSCTPAFFENLVVELLVKMGYGGSIKDAVKDYLKYRNLPEYTFLCSSFAL